MKRLAVAFTGQSDSGKTTLIQKVATNLLLQGFKVCIIKHDPKDKAQFDIEGKDSYIFSKTGADVAVMSPSRTTLFKQTTSLFEDTVALFGDFDYLLVEGLKTLPLPRICIARDKINHDYFEMSDALAIGKSIDKKKIPQNLQTFDIDDTEVIITWINKHAKHI